LVFAATAASACTEIPQGSKLWLLLTKPISSYDAKPGDRVEAVLEDDVQCADELLLAAGTPIEGEVRGVHKVGWGILHETATLDLNFEWAVPQEGDLVPLATRVVEVENARESVKGGVIHGVRATDTPQGRINSRLAHLPTLNPYSDIGLIVFKLAFPIFPEPEIHYSPGTEMTVELTAPAVGSVQPPVLTSQFSVDESAELNRLTASFPVRSVTLQRRESDLVNLALIGSEQQVGAAFRTAGWGGTDPFSKRAILREFNAILTVSCYERAPMRPMLLDERPPDMMWQKSLNSYAKRDHLRVWREDAKVGNQPVWLVAATHDSTAALSLRYKRFIHHIEPRLDRERATVIRDLKLAGCVDAVYTAPRHDVPRLTQNAVGDAMITDGDLAFVRLKDCTPGSEAHLASEDHFHAGSRKFRYVRQQILIFRSDIWRANIIYGAYDLGRMAVEQFRHPSETRVAAMAALDPAQ
jgi:hypothetical protein